jgi:hypothetical protein
MTTKNIELKKLTELKEWIEAAHHLALGARLTLEKVSADCPADGTVEAVDAIIDAIMIQLERAIRALLALKWARRRLQWRLRLRAARGRRGEGMARIDIGQILDARLGL